MLKLQKEAKVAVIGAGVSGLTFSYFLNKLRPDIKITIYEKSKRTGGWINSHKVLIASAETGKESLILEKGPRTLRGVSDGSILIVDILKQLGYKDSIMSMRKDSIANKKYLLNDSDLVQVPSDFSSFMKFISSELGNGLIRSVLKEPFQKPQKNSDETIESFITRRFGSNLLNNVLSAVIHGIYAGNVSTLSVNSILPKLVQLEHQNGSIVKAGINSMIESLKGKPKVKPELTAPLKCYETMISPNSNLLDLSKNLKQYPMICLASGLETLTSSITSYLIQNPNISILHDQNIKSINKSDGKMSISTGAEQQQFDHIRSTVNTPILSKFLENGSENSEITRCLNSLKYVSIFLCNIYLKKDVLNHHGFGFLVPRKNQNKESLLGVIFDSDVEKNIEKFYSDATKPDTNSGKQDYTKITLMMGGHYYQERGIPSTSINMIAIKKVLKEYLKIDTKDFNVIIEDKTDAEPIQLLSNDLLISYDFNEDCIPQFEVGYKDLKLKVESLLSKDFDDRLSIGGMSFGNGVGVPDVVVNSLEGAMKLSGMSEI